MKKKSKHSTPPAQLDLTRCASAVARERGLSFREASVVLLLMHKLCADAPVQAKRIASAICRTFGVNPTQLALQEVALLKRFGYRVDAFMSRAP